MKSKTLIAGAVALLSGCTATQLRYETLNQAETVESITEKQVFFNLERFDKNPYAFPSQVTVIAGSATTTNSVSPTFMTPLGTSSMVTTQLANSTTASLATALASMATNSVATAASTGASSTTTTGSTATTTNTTATTVTSGGPNTTTANTSSTAVANGTSNSLANGTTSGTTTTTTKGTTGGATTTNTSGTTGGTTTSYVDSHPNRSLSLAVSDNWMESWTLDPVVNPDVLRRLSALYRYVLGESDAARNTVVLDKQGFPDRKALKSWIAASQANHDSVDDQFMCEYALQTAAAGANAGAPTKTTTTTTQSVLGTTTTTSSGPAGEAGDDDGPVTLIFRCLVNSDGKFHKRAIRVSRASLALPDCVICLDQDVPMVNNKTIVGAFHQNGGTDSNDYAHPYVNPNLHFGFITDEAKRPDGTRNVHLGRAFYGDATIEPNAHQAFHELEALVNAATVVESTSGTTGGAKGSNPKVLAVPVSPNGFLLR
jgi:hypothetical protein